MAFGRASFSSQRGSDVVVDPVPWVNPQHRRNVSSARSSLSIPRDSNVTISGVPWSNQRNPRSSSRPSSSLSQRMPDMIIEGVGHDLPPPSMPHMKWPTRFDRSPKLTPREKTDYFRPGGLARSNSEVILPPPPPTSWKKHEVPESFYYEQKVNRYSGVNADQLDDVSRLRANSVEEKEKERYILPEEVGIARPLGSPQLESPTTLEALCGPESMAEESSNYVHSSIGSAYTSEDRASSYQDLVQSSPYFEDFDFTATDLKPFDIETLSKLEKKNVRFEGEESPASSETTFDKEIPALELAYQAVANNSVRNVHEISPNQAGDKKNSTDPRLSSIGSTGTKLESKFSEDLLNSNGPPPAIPPMSDARKALPSQRSSRASSIERPSLQSGSQPAVQEHRPGIMKAPSSSRVSSQIDSTVPPPPPESVFQPSFQEGRRPPFASSTPPQSMLSIRRPSLSASSRDNSSSSLTVQITPLSEQPRHPLAFSQLPPPSPSTTPDNAGHLAKSSEPPPPVPDRKPRNRLRKRRQSSTSSQTGRPDMQELAGASAMQAKVAPTPEPVVQPVRQPLSRKPAEENLPTSPNGTKTDPKFKKFATAVANYYKPAQTGNENLMKAENSTPAPVPAPVQITPAKPRRRSFRASSLFGNSSRLSAVPENLHGISPRTSISSRSSFQGNGPASVVSAMSPLASRDNSPIRQNFRTDSPSRPPFATASYDTGRNSPTRGGLIIETPSIPPIPPIPAVHRNSRNTSPIRNSVTSTGSLPTASTSTVGASSSQESSQLVSTADIAAFNNSRSEVLIFRRFDSVHKRVLLEMQDRIVTLEAELHHLDVFLSGEDSKESTPNDNQPSSGQLGADGDIAKAKARRQQVLFSLKSALHDYDDLLMKFNNLRVPPSDQKQAVGKFKNWLTKNGSTVSTSSISTIASNSTTTTMPPSSYPMASTSSMYNNTTPQSSRPPSSSSSLDSSTTTQASPVNSPILARASTVNFTNPSLQATISTVDPKLRDTAAAIMMGALTTGPQKPAVDTATSGEKVLVSESRRPRTRRVSTR